LWKIKEWQLHHRGRRIENTGYGNFNGICAVVRRSATGRPDQRICQRGFTSWGWWSPNIVDNCSIDRGVRRQGRRRSIDGPSPGVSVVLIGKVPCIVVRCEIIESQLMFTVHGLKLLLETLEE
jgi:hypothetical protein